METQQEDRPSATAAAYAALRHGGAGPARAGVELGLDVGAAVRAEAGFVLRAGAGGMRPRFARHRAHVAAVTAAGGYPVLAR